MSLFSDLDWVILAVAAAFLFFGPKGQEFARQIGRWYGRIGKLKDEILSEVAGSAGIERTSAGVQGSIRSVLLGIGPDAGLPVRPMTLSSAPGMITQVQPAAMWAVETQTLGAGVGAGTWWVATTSVPGELVRLR